MFFTLRTLAYVVLLATPAYAEETYVTQPHQKVTLSAESMDIVSGIIEAFMHRVKLRPGEKRCMEKNVALLTGDVMDAGLDVVNAIKAAIPKTGANGTQQHQPFNAVGTGLDGAMKITSLITLSTQLVKNCVKGDALDLLKKTGHHLINMKFVVNRFIVNGVDVAHALSDGIIAFNARDFHRFGLDIGTALRKILLSKASHGKKLPEGVPEKEIIEETTAGLMDGFFSTGSDVEITDAADTRVDINLDLHRCVAGNSDFFKDIFMGLWSLVAQMSANKEQHGLDGKTQAQSAWTNELMSALAQLPIVLQRCNVGPQTEGMMSEAIQSLTQLQVNIKFPSKGFSPKFATEEMAKAVDAWTKWKFKDFGMELGRLLRALVLQAVPQKYSLDAIGRLQLNAGVSTPTSFKPVVNTSVIVGAAVACFLALTAVRLYRSRPETASYEEASDSDSVELA
jgi:hypothetical protein